MILPDNFFVNNSFSPKNAEPKVEKKKVVDTLREMHSPKSQTPDREKVAKAAGDRFKDEEERKQARKEKAIREKEKAKRAEEDEIKAMKKEAAKKAEALERKEAARGAKARLDAAAAAEERAATAAAMSAYNMHATPETSFKKEMQDRESVSTSKELQPSKMSGGFALHNKIKRHKEEIRKIEEQELAVKKKAAAEAGEALKIREAIKATEAKAAAAAAALARAAKIPTAADGMQPSVNSNTKVQEKEIIDVNSEKHILKAGTENMITGTFHDYTKEDKTLNLIDYSKSENQLRQIGGEQKNNRNVMNSNANEKAPVNRSKNQEDLEKMTGFSEAGGNASQSGARPKEMTLEPDGQARPYTSSSSIAKQEYENESHRQEKESLSVMGNNALQPRISGSRKEKEIVSVTGYEKSLVKESVQSLRYEVEKSDIHHSGYDNRRKVKNSETEENEKEHMQGYQNNIQSDRDCKDPIHLCEQSCRNQHDNTPLAQGNKGYQHTHQQPYYREQQNYHQNHGRMIKGYQDSPSYNHQPHAQKPSQIHSLQRALMCGFCGENFNLKKNLPRNLCCGHSICTYCIDMQIYHNKELCCPSCSAYSMHVKSSEECPVNQPLVKILSEESMQDEATRDQGRRGLHLPEGNGRRQYQSQPGNNNMARIIPEQVGNKSLLPKSPHGSKCLEVGVRPSSYCCTCDVWVCSRCAESEHSTRKCSVKPLRDQLTVMKQRIEHEGRRAQQLLGKSLQSLENSLNKDKIFLIWMRAAFECVEKKQDGLKKELEGGRKLMNTLIDKMQSVPSATNLPEALATFQSMEGMASTAEQWVSSADLSATDGDQETAACLRHLMRRTLRSYKVENQTSELCVVDKLLGSELQSELRVDGGRFHLHALRRRQPHNQGVRALPVECFKPCQPAVSTLVFLDLSWNGANQGRLYIRLTGDTLQGRQFLRLCIGEGGISFQGTCFHRVWWKGLPGEHIWTGDCEKGDGSGGKPLFSSNNHEDTPAGRKVPISAGLVAGRYEKENISSIFRIYTREEKEGKDEAGFGQVEFGLDVLREAVKLRNIQDVIISDCGLVIEM